MKFVKFLFTCCFCLAMVFMVSAQTQTGSIRGIAVDNDNNPLPGVTITTTSPSLIGSISGISTETGAFRLPAIPPGTYKIVAELPGFKTIIRENVIVRVGMVVTINLQMDPSAINEEVTVVAPSPIIDITSSKATDTVTTDDLKNLPLTRNLAFLLSAAAGIDVVDQYRNLYTHGGDQQSNSFNIDGVSVNDPIHYALGTNINFDVIEEIEVITSGQPAEIGNTPGAYVNAVSRSGGNRFSADLVVYYTNEDLTQILFSDTLLKSIGIGKPVAPVLNLDTSVNVGGAIIKDKIWFFSSFNRLLDYNHHPFVPTVINGKDYPAFDTHDVYWKGFVKFTSQLSKSLRMMIMGNIEDTYYPYAYGSWNMPPETHYIYDHRRDYVFNIVPQWTIDPNTFVVVKFGLYNRISPLPVQPGTDSIPTQLDQYTGYYFGAGPRTNEWVQRKSWQASANITRFQDNLLGGDHELKAGIGFQTGMDTNDLYKSNPMGIRYYNGSPYYYRGLYGLSQPHPIYGDGYVWFRAIAPEHMGSYTRGDQIRIDGFIQDSWTIKNRLTINAGIRYDYYDAWLPKMVKEPTLGVAYDIGEYYFLPKYGFNVYGRYELDKLDHAIQWSTLSPRIGLTFDVFGNGKTALKVSYGKYNKPLRVNEYEGMHPSTGSYNFNWWDLNENQVQDAPPVDRYDLVGTSPEEILRWKQLINPNVGPIIYHEYTAGLSHALNNELSVSLLYVHKRQWDNASNSLYDPISKRFWYTYDLAPEWWVPFTTIVPGYGIYPNQELTMYFPSKNSPSQFRSYHNTPEAKMVYDSIDLSFNKRMSRGWMLGGNVQLARQNVQSAGSSPNDFVNGYGRASLDRPLIIKFYGSFQVPYGITASFLYLHYDGAPFQRTVTVYPPAGWAKANNALTAYSYTISTETSGHRRYQASDNVDFRLEKEFGLGKAGRIGMFLDVLNLLGYSSITIVQNPGGTWRPSNADTKVGVFTASPNYGKPNAITGARVFKISVRYSY